MLKSRVRNVVILTTLLTAAASLTFGVYCKKSEPGRLASKTVPASKVPKLTSKDQLKSGFVLLDTGMNYCPNCANIAAEVERLVIRFQTQSLKLFKLNFHENSDLVYAIMGDTWNGFPVVLFFKDGNEVHRLLGGADYDWMIRDLKRLEMVVAGPEEGKQVIKPLIVPSSGKGRGLNVIN